MSVSSASSEKKIGGKKDARNKSQAAPKEEGAVDWGVAGFVGDDDDGGGATMLGAAKGKPGTASATDTREAEAKKNARSRQRPQHCAAWLRS